MTSRIDQNGVSWIDINRPSPEEIIKAEKELGIHPRVVQELLRPSFRTRAESFGHHIYLILHIPVFDHDLNLHRSREIDVVINKNTLLTVHYESIEAAHDFFRALNLNLGLREKIFKAGPDAILHSLWVHLYENLMGELDHVQRKIDRIEERIFAGHERELIHDISLLRRDILDFGRTVRPHDGVLESLERMGKDFFSEEFSGNLYELWGHYRRIIAILESNRDTLETLYATNDSLLTHRSNEIIKTLTMLALLTFPLTLIAAIFSINAKHTPIIGRENDFWIILGIMTLTVSVMLAFFKHKRWL